MQSNTVTVSAIPHGVVRFVQLLCELQKLVGINLESLIYRGFNGPLVAKSPRKTIPLDTPVNYEQFLRYLSLWFSGVIGSFSTEF